MAGLPPSYDLPFVAGDTVRFKFQVTDRADPEDPPVPRDLTGWEVESHVRTTPPAETIEAEWEIDFSGTEGIIQMYLSPETTQPWAAIKTLASDVQLTDPAGDVETILKIKLKAAQDVTRE